MTVEQAINLLKRHDVRPSESMATEGLPAMVFACSFAGEGTTPDEWQRIPGACPEELNQFWQITESAKLFEDTTYGQWGLEILSPSGAIQRTKKFKQDRPTDSAEGDLIVGRFIGDSDLLLVRCDADADDFGAVVVAGPIDPRADWDIIANSFGEFLNRYVEARGEMYWTHKPTTDG